jgi:hypothetical protein
LTWEPTLIRFSLEQGADPTKDNPFAIAFGAKVRTALRPFTEFKQDHPERADALQEQVNIALRHFCSGRPEMNQPHALGRSRCPLNEAMP